MSVKPILLAFALGSALCGASPARAACPPPAPEGERVRLAGIDPSGDPLLSDGRRLRLAGLAPRQNDEDAARFASAIAQWSDRDWHLQILGPADRWGRLPARLLATAEEPTGTVPDLAGRLLAANAASPLPERRERGCDAPPRGVATAPALDGHDVAAIKAQAGRVVSIEGRIASVGERTQRTYLNFSRRRGEGAAVVLSRGLWRVMRDQGWTAAGLAGKRLRAHGILSGRDGLLLEVTAQDALELID